jgi:hypothetical protein
MEAPAVSQSDLRPKLRYQRVLPHPDFPIYPIVTPPVDPLAADRKEIKARKVVRSPEVISPPTDVQIGRGFPGLEGHAIHSVQQSLAEVAYSQSEGINALEKQFEKGKIELAATRVKALELQLQELKAQLSRLKTPTLKHVR